jgi:TonB dependent receptor
LNFTSPETAALKSERALQAVVGVERQLDHGLSLRVEAYGRRLDGLIVGRLETDAERQLRLAEYVPDRWTGDLQKEIPVDPLITNVPVNAGAGRARGVEVLFTQRPRSTNSRFSGWASYTLSKAERETYGLTYPFDYDRRHAATLVGEFRVSPRVTTSVAMQAASGLPVTVPSGVRITPEPAFAFRDGRPVLFPWLIEVVDGGPIYPVYVVDYGPMARINSARLAPSSRVDFRATLHPKDANGHWTFYVDVINVLNHRNRLAVFSTLDYNPYGPKPVVTNTYAGGFPILPSLGLKYRF